MFTYILTTNSVCKETSKTIDILLETKRDDDSIIVVNYNNFDIDYKNTEGIDYRHINQSVNMCINMVLPDQGDVVVLEYGVSITKKFVDDLYKHYDPGCLCALRTDKSNKNGKFVESDYRIGTTINFQSFIYFTMAFNVDMVSKIYDTPEKTAEVAFLNGVSLKLLPNVRTIISSTPSRIIPEYTPQTPVDITILIPSLNYLYKSEIRDSLSVKDKLYEFDSDPVGVVKFINKTMLNGVNDCVVIINPNTDKHPKEIIDFIRKSYNGKCIYFDNVRDIVSDDMCIVISKSNYKTINTVFSNIVYLFNHLLSLYEDKRFVDYKTLYPKKKKKLTSTKPKSVSIIIPYMHLGDRWNLFEKCIDNLYNHTKDHKNIEIVVHECGEEKFISQYFIEKYNLVYMFSRYKGVFHRAWCLNVASRYMSKGGTLVFFDGDLIIDKSWVNELLSCDATKPYMGWGYMNNLTEKSTKTYIKTGNLVNDFESTRTPDGTGAAGGINIVPRDMFFNIGGWPEDYEGTYGGEDNSFFFKMSTLGMYR